MTLITAVRGLVERAAPRAVALLVRSRIRADRIGPVMHYEPELQILPSLVSDSGLALDVGANIGNYSIAMVDICGTSRVVAFEPVPWLARRLRRLLPRLRIEEVAVSRKEGEATLRVPRIGSRLVAERSTIEAEVQEKDQTGQLVILVRTIALDALRQTGMLGPVGFIKIDVEGHEHEVLCGAKRLLARDRPNLVLEAEQRHHKFPLADIFGVLAKADYVGSFIDALGGCLRDLSAFDVGEHQNPQNHGTRSYVANFVFVPAERAESIRSSLQKRLRQRLA